MKKKLNSITIKVVTITVVSVILMATIIGTIGVQNSHKVLKQEAEQRLLVTNKYYADKFSDKLTEIELSINILSQLLLSTLELDQVKDKDAEYLKLYEGEADEILNSFAKHNDHLVSISYFMNPELTIDVYGSWYVDQTGDGILDKQNLLSVEDFTPNNEKMNWYYTSINTQKPVWLQFTDTQRNTEMITYAKPLFKENQLVGVIGLDLNFDYFKNLISDFKIYDTGYAFLLDENYNYSIHPTLSKEDNMVTIAGGKYKYIADLMENKSEVVFSAEFGNTNKLLSFVQIKNGWILLMSAPTKEVMGAIIETSNLIILIIIVGSIVTILGAYFFINKTIKPIKNVVIFADDIANGKLNLENLTVSSKDEIGQMTLSLNTMKNQLREMISGVKNIVQQITISSEELSAFGEQVGRAAEQVGDSIQSVASGAEEQSAQVEETAGILEDMKNRIEVVVTSIEKLAEDGSLVIKNIEMGSTSVQNSIDQIDNVKNSSSEVTKLMTVLGDTSQEIGNIVGLIKSIAEQTNLLALNAAIEAARAGDAGRGFSIVADEIRSLAEDSSEATEKIAGLINKIQFDITQTINKVKQSEEEVENSVEVIGMTNQAFDEIIKISDKLIKGLGDVSVQTREMDRMSKSVKSAIDNIAAVSQEAASNSEEVAASSEEQVSATSEIVSSATRLAEISEELSVEVDKFKL